MLVQCLRSFPHCARASFNIRPTGGAFETVRQGGGVQPRFRVIGEMSPDTTPPPQWRRCLHKEPGGERVSLAACGALWNLAMLEHNRTPMRQAGPLLPTCTGCFPWGVFSLSHLSPSFVANQSLFFYPRVLIRPKFPWDGIPGVRTTPPRHPSAFSPPPSPYQTSTVHHPNLCRLFALSAGWDVWSVVCP